MTVNEQEAHNRALVKQVYEAAFAGDFDAFTNAMDDDFEEYVPSALPWGGTHRGAAKFLNEVMPKLGAAVDFSTMRLVSVAADGDRVAVLTTAQSSAGDELWISEHWTLRDDKLWRMRVFYFDTAPLQER
jgi:ketosteroid isomerase-like protein